MPSRYEKYATHHASRRTDGWDYTQPAAYFVTICTVDRRCLFGGVERGRMVLNALGKIVAEEWQRSEEVRDRVHLDAFVVMPNHLHGIVVFADPDVNAPTCPRGYRVFGTTGKSKNPSQESNAENASHGGVTELTNSAGFEKASTHRSTLGGKSDDRDDESDDDRPRGPAPRSLGSFIAGFKSAATTCINDHRGTPGAPVWQRNYHDVIIKDERHWQNARAYIRRNPAQWHTDRLHHSADP